MSELNRTFLPTLAFQSRDYSMTWPQGGPHSFLTASIDRCLTLWSSEGHGDPQARSAQSMSSCIQNEDRNLEIKADSRVAKKTVVPSKGQILKTWNIT